MVSRKLDNEITRGSYKGSHECGKQGDKRFLFVH